MTQPWGWGGAGLSRQSLVPSGVPPRARAQSKLWHRWRHKCLLPQLLRPLGPNKQRKLQRESTPCQKMSCDLSVMPRSPGRLFCPARLHAHTSTFAALAIIFVKRLCRGGGIDCDVDTRAGWAFPIGMRLLACRRPYGRCTCKARTWLANLRPPSCVRTQTQEYTLERACAEDVRTPGHPNKHNNTQV